MWRLRLAEQFHMTLNQLDANMTPAELTLWQIYFSVKNQDAAKSPQLHCARICRARWQARWSLCSHTLRPA